MKRFLLGIISIIFIVLLSCVGTKELVVEENLTDIDSVLNTINEISSIGVPTYNQTMGALMAADEAITKLQTYVSRLEWELYKAKNPIKARVIELEEEGWEVYVVKEGDWLSTIAFKFFGNTEDYWKIWNQNLDIISDVNVISPNQVLRIKRKV